VGDIATVFFRADGTYRNIELNRRASGPDLDLFRRAKHTICVVSGPQKVDGVRGAMRGGFIKELIIDEPTARLLLSTTPDPKCVPQGGNQIAAPHETAPVRDKGRRKRKDEQHERVLPVVEKQQKQHDPRNGESRRTVREGRKRT
ncbi:sugar-binding domain-containing protein, partial [Paraburkholderia sp.]|uniref:sugar-binding domain-containing protein n=1 Tax=Paraburkholderia sp. TaxID=1926495 RepID=UPI002F42C3A8